MSANGYLIWFIAQALVTVGLLVLWLGVSNDWWRNR